jgi:hypothetical protein
MMKIWNKNTRPDFKQKYNPGLVFYPKNPGSQSVYVSIEISK